MNGRVGFGYLAAWLTWIGTWSQTMKSNFSSHCVFQGCFFRIAEECAEGEVEDGKGKKVVDKGVQLSTVCRGIVSRAKGLFFRAVVGCFSKRSAWMSLQSSPCRSKRKKSMALQMGVLPSCNVSNPQRFWMVASFFESWVLMCMISWWALGANVHDQLVSSW